MATTAAKVCTVCKRDCADLPRVKDEHGRYTCRACLDGSPSASSAAARPAREDDGFDIRAAAQMEAKSAALDLPESQSCPKCHGFLPDAARVCMRCGFDRKRGSKVQTKVEKLKEVKESRRHPLDVTWIVVGFGLLTVGCAVSVFALPVMILPAFMLLAALGLGLYITVIACQFRDGETVYGIVSIIGFFTGGLASIVTLFWLFAVNDRGWLKGLWACMVLSYVILIAAIITSDDGFAGVFDSFSGGSDGGGGGVDPDGLEGE